VLLLSVSYYISTISADAAFYLSPFRFYQFMFGAVFATLAMTGQRDVKLDIASGILWIIPAVAMILLSVFEYRSGVPQFLAQFAMSLLVAGSCFYLEKAAPRPGRWSLGGKLPVLIGSRSYAIYLAHWPLILAARALWPNPSAAVKAALTIGLILASVLLGFVLAAAVERPIRLHGRCDPRRALKGWLTAAAVTASFAASATFTLIGTQLRPPGQTDVAALHKQFDRERGQISCVIPLRRGELDGAMGACLTSSKPNILVIGDSLTDAVAIALNRAAAESDNVVMLRAEGCPPYFGDNGHTLQRLNDIEACRRLGGNDWRYVAERIDAWAPRLAGVVVVGNWSAPLFGFDDLGVNLDRFRSLGVPVGFVGVFPVLSQSATRLSEAGKIGQDRPDAAAFLSKSGWGSDVRERERYLLEHAPPTITYISVLGALCGADCPAYFDGQLVYFDRQHLAPAGVAKLVEAKVFAPFLASVKG
jgi:peptidoglycan/LPS O-acetylase OafA/YrhL